MWSCNEAIKCYPHADNDFSQGIFQSLYKGVACNLQVQTLSSSKTTKQNRKCLFSRQLLWHQEVWDALDMQEMERPLGIEVTKDVENGDEGKA